MITSSTSRVTTTLTSPSSSSPSRGGGGGDVEREGGQDGGVVEVLLLGAAQDGGFPQFGCKCSNCQLVYQKKVPSDSAVSLAILDHSTLQWWLVDATPQLCLQWEEFASILTKFTLAGVFLTHAHAGHYPGLLYFGKEAMNTKHLPVYASVKMHSFLAANEPWGVMYRNENFKRVDLTENKQEIELSPNVKISPHFVEHRADFTDTFAFKIYGKGKSLYFCPDIDSWSNMDESLPVIAQTMDILLVDSTFYDDNELPGRDMSVIPHPRVVQTMNLLEGIPFKQVVLIHINHSNKLWVDEDAVREVQAKGMTVGRKGMTWKL